MGQVLTKDNSSPLALACKGNNNIAAQLLLENGAKVNEANTRVRNGLQFASMHGNTDIVKMLICKGEMNYCLKNKESALYYTARNGHSQVTEILLSDGAERELQDFRCNSPFYIAYRNGHVNLVNRFLEYSKEFFFFENLDSDTAPSLQAAIESGNDAIVELILQSRANVVSMLKSSEKDILCLVAELGHVGIVQLLIERKAVEMLKRKKEDTHHLSMIPCLVTTARCLLEDRADINKCDASGKSPLFYAARYGHLDVVGRCSTFIKP